MTWLVGNWKLLLAAFAIGAFGGWHGHTIIDQAKQAKELSAEIVQHQLDVQAANDHSADLEKELARLRNFNQTVNQEKENALAKTNPAINCALPVERLHIINEIIAGHAAR